MLRYAILATIFLMSVTAAQAAGAKNYFGIGLRNFSENNDTDLNDGRDLEASGIQITFGQKVSRHLAWELNFSRDNYDAFDYTTDEGIDLEFDTEADQFGLSLLFSPVRFRAASPYIRLAYGNRDWKADFTASRGQTSVSGTFDSFESESGTWWGVGLKIHGSRKFDINIEASRFTEDSFGVYVGPQFYF